MHQDDTAAASVATAVTDTNEVFMVALLTGNTTVGSNVNPVSGGQVKSWTPW
jgi:hypothetical protein